VQEILHEAPPHPFLQLEEQFDAVVEHVLQFVLQGTLHEAPIHPF